MKKLSDYLFYQDNWATIYCGDCKEITPLIEESIELLLTDPLYGIKSTTMNRSANRGKQFLKGIVTEAHDWGEFKDDRKAFDPLFWLHFPKVILWGGNHYANQLPPSSMWIIWDKRCGVLPDDNADCEIAWTNLKGVARIHRQLWKGICREGKENIAISGSKLHPFQKPIGLMQFCIGLSFSSGGILDPFLGSGTTCVAAKNLNRKSIGIEIEPKYCEIAVKRLRQEPLDFKG